MRILAAFMIIFLSSCAGGRLRGISFNEGEIAEPRNKSIAAGDNLIRAVSVEFFGVNDIDLQTDTAAGPRMSLLTSSDMSDVRPIMADTDSAMGARIVYERPFIFWEAQDGKGSGAAVETYLDQTELALLKDCGWTLKTTSGTTSTFKDEEYERDPHEDGIMLLKRAKVITSDVIVVLRYGDGRQVIGNTRCRIDDAGKLLGNSVARKLIVAGIPAEM